MDVSFTNVLAGARQYFQGLPVPSTATDTAQSHSLTTTTSSSYNKNEPTTGGTAGDRAKDSYPCSYWNPTEELRVVEPSAPQPTKVEVADTRPSGESAPSSATELTEMQPSVKRPEYKQLPKSAESPVYQQLRSQQYSADRSVYPQRTQYYPRYHHPDITKSTPLPQGSNSAPPNSARESRSSTQQDEAQRLYPNSVGCPTPYHSAPYNRATINNTHPLSSATSSSHIPPVHIPPQQHLPPASSSSSSQAPHSYQVRPETNHAPSGEQMHYAQAPTSQYHSAPMIHNVAPFQPHSPTYPPPSPRSLPYTVPSGPQQQYPQNYPNYPPSQSSYHSFQKSSSQSSYYPVPRSGHIQATSGYSSSKGASCNGEMKRPEGMYPYQQQQQQRPETHNLPPIAAFSSYHSTRPATPAVNKSQPSLQRQRKEPSVANGRVSTPSYPMYSQSFSAFATTAASHRANTSSSSSTTLATQSYAAFATTVASHRANNSSTTTVASIGSTYTSSESREGYRDYPRLSSSSPAQPTPTLSRANGTAIEKRESPLDLSVKTVKTSADSTAQDLDLDQDKNHPMLPPQVPYPPNGRLPVGRPVCAPKVEFYPDFNSAPMRNNQQRLKQSYQPLPHMSSFKKTSLPTPTYNPNDSLPRTSRHPAIENKIAPDYYPGLNKDPLKREAPYSMGGPSNKYPKIESWEKKLPPKEQLKRHNASPAPPNGHLVAPAQFDQRNEQYALEAHRYPNLCDEKNYPDVMNPSFGHPTSKSSAFAAIPASSTLTYPTYRPENKAYMPPTGGVPGFEHPGNSGADKRILSLLRNNLENKHQKDEFYAQQPGLPNHNQQSFQNKVVAPVEPKTNIGRHNLSPFTAASLLERNSNTPPHYKFYVPKAVDSITQDGPRGNYTSRVNPATTLTSKDDLLSPRDADNQIYRDKDDGLAAILAAKIRTKAELKQVNLSHNVWRSTTSLPQDQSVTPKDVDGASTSTPHSSSSAGSPPKLTREKTPVAVPRRRLFSKSEEESLLLSGAVPGGSTAVPPLSVSPRAIGPRSSSEASVFDFRESDSEGEMPVLERQTLEEMRRDRKQLSKVQPPMPLDDAMGIDAESSQDLVKIELRENEKATESDPFWSATCDKFMEQLRYGDSCKKRGRRKKSEVTTPGKIEAPVLPEQILPENIKQEVLDESSDQSKTLEPPKLSPMEIKKEPEEPVADDQEETPRKSPEEPAKEPKSSGDESDEVPLIKRGPKKKLKIEDDDEDDVVPVRKHATRRGSRMKLESSSENESSSEESDAGVTTSVAERLRNRKQGVVETGAKMKLRSREGVQKPKTEVKTPQKAVAQKGKPKPLFGDGSDFRPGWEEEVYVYKKSLRMPTRLITVSKPSRFHRLSTSLPDLDPASPALSVSMDSSDVYLNRKRADSDLESNCSFSIKNDDEEATSSTTISCPTKLGRGRLDGPSSIVDVLAQKVGTGKKELKKKNKEKDKDKEKEVPKILKKSNEPELLPTPSLAPLLDDESPTKKGKSPLKKSAEPIKVTDSFLLGYFGKETVNNFRDAFKNNHTVPDEFSTLILKSRTRTETRVMKKQATIKEVFGEDRPASAPPMQNHAGDTSQDDDSQNESKTTNSTAKTRTLKEKVVSRLRNAGILKSSKDKVVKEEKEKEVKKEKESPMKKRRKEMLKSMPDKKLKKGKKEAKGEDEENEDNDEANEDEDEEEEDEPEEEDEDEDTTQENNEAETETIEDGGEAQTKRKLKFRSEKFRKRKFRSGFDYIRKKKKPPLKKDEVTVPKERKRQGITRSNPECVADIQAEIRTWVIKKGVGETILHRASRLGYTDVAAYCLEKLNCAPNPKDNAGYTPLHEACSRGHLEIAKLLLAYGANVSESANGGIRPLHEAAENGDAELVRLLLSYGADPLLATYAGQTPLVLAADSEAYRVLEQHIDDIQGRRNVPWHFQGPSSIFDPQKSGFDPLDNAPDDLAESELDEVEMEVSDVNLPVLFTLTNEPDKWILLPDLMTALKVESRDALLRQVNPKAPSGPPAVAHREVMREMKLADFLEQSRCCHLMSAGEKINVRGSKVTLIKYNERVRSLLNVERVVISLR